MNTLFFIGFFMGVIPWGIMLGKVDEDLTILGVVVQAIGCILLVIALINKLKAGF